jgi:hypothetical protein
MRRSAQRSASCTSCVARMRARSRRTRRASATAAPPHIPTSSASRSSATCATCCRPHNAHPTARARVGFGGGVGFGGWRWRQGMGRMVAWRALCRALALQSVRVRVCVGDRRCLVPTLGVRAGGLARGGRARAGARVAAGRPRLAATRAVCVACAARAVAAAALAAPAAASAAAIRQRTTAAVSALARATFAARRRRLPRGQRCDIAVCAAVRGRLPRCRPDHPRRRIRAALFRARGGNGRFADPAARRQRSRAAALLIVHDSSHRPRLQEVSLSVSRSTGHLG